MAHEVELHAVDVEPLEQLAYDRLPCTCAPLGACSRHLCGSPQSRPPLGIVSSGLPIRASGFSRRKRPLAPDPFEVGFVVAVHPYRREDVRRPASLTQLHHGGQGAAALVDEAAYVGGAVRLAPVQRHVLPARSPLLPGLEPGSEHLPHAGLVLVHLPVADAPQQRPNGVPRYVSTIFSFRSRAVRGGWASLMIQPSSLTRSGRWVAGADIAVTSFGLPVMDASAHGSQFHADCRRAQGWNIDVSA